jgi:hypothetical protein
MEMRFWKVNNKRFRGFRVLIILGLEKIPTYAFGTRM